jgi:hypothetical protein
MSKHRVGSGLSPSGGRTGARAVVTGRRPVIWPNMPLIDMDAVVVYLSAGATPTTRCRSLFNFDFVTSRPGSSHDTR